MTPFPHVEGQAHTEGRQFRFSQVDVFSEEPFRGNGLAVIHQAQGTDGAGLSDDDMAGIAAWTQLSETAFLFPPTDPAADYRVRIFTPRGELSFAGHPTLGSARAWLAMGAQPKHTGEIIQQCDAGNIRVRWEGAGLPEGTAPSQLAFAAPSLTSFGEVDPEVLRSAVEGCGLEMSDVLAANWVVNGPQWLGILVRDARIVARAHPRTDEMGVGIIGAYPAGGPADYEVRAFCHDVPGREDPVTGSLNAGLAQWLTAAGLVPDRYTVSQGTWLGRKGHVTLSREGSDIWVGGAVSVRVTGTLLAG